MTQPSETQSINTAESTRKAEYTKWISEYLARTSFVRGTCKKATSEMVKEFPELRQAAGFVDVHWGTEEHFWCVAPDGTIVDPTEAQYGPVGVIHYEELDLNNPEDVKRIPTGKCPNCGEPSFEHRYFCSDECGTSYAAYINR